MSKRAKLNKVQRRERKQLKAQEPPRKRLALRRPTYAQTLGDEIKEDVQRQAQHNQLTLGLADAMPTPQKTKWLYGAPPYIGWWEVATIHWIKETMSRLVEVDAQQLPRRWWNGEAWSWAVEVGDRDDYAETMKHRTSNVQDFYYRGLTMPHPNGYEWTLIPDHEAKRFEA